MKKCLCFILLVLITFGCTAEKTHLATEKPNYIILQADDLGWDDIPLTIKTW
jgi:hypothetical protein